MSDHSEDLRTKVSPEQHRLGECLFGLHHVADVVEGDGSDRDLGGA